MSTESKAPIKLEVTVDLNNVFDIDELNTIYQIIIRTRKEPTFEESNTILQTLHKFGDSDSHFRCTSTSILAKYCIIYKKCSEVIQKHYAEQVSNASTIQEALKKLIEYAKNGTTKHTSKLLEEERTVVDALRKSNQSESLTMQEMAIIAAFRKSKAT